MSPEDAPVNSNINRDGTLGKTTYILSKLKEEAGNIAAFTGRPRQKLLVIVPLLSEIERYQRTLPSFAFKEPSEYDTKKLRKQGHGKKFYDLVRLVENGENIITTHSLFSKMDRDLYAKIQAAGYELVIDEVLETVTLYKGLSAHDRGILFDQNMVSVDPRRGVSGGTKSNGVTMTASSGR
jgi:hypothetical protein